MKFGIKWQRAFRRKRLKMVICMHIAPEQGQKNVYVIWSRCFTSYFVFYCCGSITAVGEERANLSVIVYVIMCFLFGEVSFSY